MAKSGDVRDYTKICYMYKCPTCMNKKFDPLKKNGGYQNGK